MTEMTCFPRHCYSVIDKAVDQWTARLCACVKAFQSHLTTKQALFRVTHSLPKKTSCTLCV